MRYLVLLALLVPGGVEGQESQYSRFSYFTDCAPIMVTGSVISAYRGAAQPLPDDVRADLVQPLIGAELLTYEPFTMVTDTGGAPVERASPIFRATVVEYGDGGILANLALQKLFFDPASRQSGYATTWNVNDVELPEILGLTKVMLDSYQVANAPACEARRGES